MTVEIVLNAHATIGASPTWVAEEEALYWIDVKAPALHRYLPANAATRTWVLTSDVGAFALMKDGGALVALREGLCRLDLDAGTLDRLAPPPFDPALFRFNEGACDTKGRFWVSVMFDPLEGSPPKRCGNLHSFTLGGSLRLEPDAAELHNGMAWSADGSIFSCHTATPERSSRSITTWKAAAFPTAAFSQPFPRGSASPTAPRSTATAVTGAPFMAGAS